MKAKEFITEDVSDGGQLSYIARFIEQDWPNLEAYGGCMGTAIIYSIAKEMNIKVPMAFKWLAKTVEDNKINIHSLPQLIELLEHANLPTNDNGVTRVKISIFAPSLDEVIGLVKADHPSVLIFDSFLNSPLMNAIVDSETYHKLTGKWDGVVRPTEKELKGYTFPPKPKKVPKYIEFQNMLMDIPPAETHNHAMLIVGYDAGEKTLVCRDTNPLKGLKGYLKFPTDLVKYTKLLAFKATRA